MAQTTIVYKVSPNLKNEIIEFYKDRFLEKKPPYSVFQVKDFDCVTTLYDSGKIMFQGIGADIEASYWIERERILNNRNVSSELASDMKKKDDKKKEQKSHCNRKLMEQCRILGEYAQYVEKVRENAEIIAMSIFEYDKEEEEQKLQATYEKIGEKRGEKQGD